MSLRKPVQPSPFAALIRELDKTTCPHPARRGRHEVYGNPSSGTVFCRACGAGRTPNAGAIPVGPNGRHACPDWDYLVIDAGSVEWDGCVCTSVKLAADVYRLRVSQARTHSAGRDSACWSVVGAKRGETRLTAVACDDCRALDAVGWAPHVR